MELGEREVAAIHLRNALVSIETGWPFVRPGDYARMGGALLRLAMHEEGGNSPTSGVGGGPQRPNHARTS